MIMLHITVYFKPIYTLLQRVKPNLSVHLHECLQSADKKGFVLALIIKSPPISSFSSIRWLHDQLIKRHQYPPLRYVSYKLCK